MANITTTIGGNIGALMTVAAQKGLDALKANLVMARRIRKDTDFESAVKGQALTIPIFGTFAAGDKAANTAASLSVPSDGDKVTVTLNKHKYVDVMVEDIARTLARPDLIDGYAQSMSVALAEAIESDILALASGFSTSVGTYGSLVTGDTLKAAAKALTDNKIAMAGRNVVLSSKDFYGLFDDSELASWLAFNQANITDGAIKNLYGFEVFVSQLVKFDATPTPDETYNLAFNAEAIVLATRPFADVIAPGAEVASVTDPDQGISLRVTMSWDHAARAHRLGMDVLYGVAECRDKAGVLVKG